MTGSVALPAGNGAAAAAAASGDSAANALVEGARAATACGERLDAVPLASADDPKLMGNDAKGTVGRVAPLGSGEGLNVRLGSGGEPIDC